MKNSRTKNSAINVIVSSISKVMTLVLSFACRTFFIQTLGKEYLGVNGLFSNILTILSFAELGIGNAIIFKLYKPIAEEDKTDKLLDNLLLKKIIKDLDERDKKIIYLRYYLDQTQSDVAKELGVSQVQVSRLEFKILEKIKRKFNS